MTTVVTTTYGSVCGRVEDGMHVFRGIRYGAPTGGAHRFRPPKPPEAWDGTRPVNVFGPVCPQVSLSGKDRDVGDDGLIADITATPQAPDEDCLVLNVWSSGPDPAARRPVLVWIHGGGFHAGSGSAPLYDGRALASRGDAVVVTLNHRLGILGFLELGHLDESYRGSGVVGLLDLVAALEWVRDNIAAFGGDPGNVTVFGESGGGQKVGALLAMPAAHGLLHRAVLQSGATLHVGRRINPCEVTEFVLDHLGVAPDELDRLPVDTLVGAAAAAAARFGVMVFEPVVDSVHLPDHPVDLLRGGAAAGVPILIGTNTNEFRFTASSMPATLDDDGAIVALAGLIGQAETGAGGCEPFLAYRERLSHLSAPDLFGEVFTDYTHVLARRYAAAKAAQGDAPVFVYLYDEPPAYHGSELRYLFRYGITDTVADLVSDTWLAFARDGDPNHAGLPPWQPYSGDAGPVMLLRGAPELVPDPLHVALERWEAIPSMM